MIKVASDADRVAAAKLQEEGQGHVFNFWDEISPADQKELLRQIRRLDLPKVLGLILQYRETARSAGQSRVYEPSRFLELPTTRDGGALWAEARQFGEEALRGGKVAIAMSAGDLAESEGFTAPKGTYPVGPVSGKCLFHLHAERLLALKKRYRANLPLFVITSVDTHESTTETFREHQNFNLSRQDVKFVSQESLPVINRRGQLILRGRSELSFRPTGHGGAMTRLLEEDVFKSLEIQGIEYIFFCQVGNPLVRIGDPTMIGHHVSGQYDVTSKAVLKTDTEERIDVFCRCNGALTVVGPRELGEEEFDRRLVDGRLAHGAGNAAIHVFSMSYLRALREDARGVPFHFVEQRTPFIDRRGRLVNPRKPNSIVFENSVSDLLSRAEKTLVIETSREEEFLPIWHSKGDHSPESASRALSELYRSWLDRIGAEIPDQSVSDTGDANVERRVEISPLFALDVAELQERMSREQVELPPDATSGLYLE